MEKFEITGINKDFLKLSFLEVFGFPEKTSHFGGYDTETEVKLSSGGFNAKITINTSTGEIYDLYKTLLDCHKNVSGSAYFLSYENNLRFSINYELTGKVLIKGELSEYLPSHNSLNFEIESDQSYIQSTIEELELMFSKYGNENGVISN